MSLDVIDLRTFYDAALGRVAQRFIHRILRERWSNCIGLSVVGIGYATPFLSEFHKEAMRTLAFMPAAQGVVNWPQSGLSASTLVDMELLPLPDSCIDRVLLVHALEVAEQPSEVLSEIWRVLTPGGRLMIVAPSRRGLWAGMDNTPFGVGQPFSKSQLRNLMRDTLFSPIHWQEALFIPPFERRLWLSAAGAFERIGNMLPVPGAGVYVVEATKQLYRPVAIRKLARRMLPKLEPAIAAPNVGMHEPLGRDGRRHDANVKRP
ncbi:class I SAM-dependent methyltransferase [Methylovirgula sp. 4M-Z18]|uniref:class I SAM-dependent methyltransferase n=1 Tax=Methylovirgula sp. 4M-Z18 TaxID=2293567 RepID=UPI000E2F3A81|nr:methyltransferase domain-containing protein [Methylovirgula sp. 4M-Z18]RFB78098.1 SAM-dependent methyltransferase [Methylovirgula sp. 4M-Z18]